MPGQEAEVKYTFEEYLTKFNRIEPADYSNEDDNNEFADELARETLEAFEKALQT